MKVKINKILLLSLLLVTLIGHGFTKIDSVQSAVKAPMEDKYLSEEKHIENIANTIALIETNHTLDCTKIGKNGEKGCFQFLSSTWKAYSKDVLGYVAPQTATNTKLVVEGKIKEWKKQGLTDRQIFLIWNQGNPGKCKAGVNSKGVKYDSCAYADKAVKLLSMLSTQKKQIS